MNVSQGKARLAFPSLHLRALGCFKLKIAGTKGIFQARKLYLSMPLILDSAAGDNCMRKTQQTQSIADLRKQDYAASFFFTSLHICLLWSKQATHTLSAATWSWTMQMSILCHLYLIELENTSTSTSSKLIWMFELWMFPPSCYRCTVSFF